MYPNPEPRIERGLIRLSEVLKLIPVSRSGWWKGCREGRYPAPLKIGPRTTVWRRADVEALVADARPGPPANEQLLRGRRRRAVQPAA